MSSVLEVNEQGGNNKSISGEFAEYVLSLAATNIVLLVGIYIRRNKYNLTKEWDYIKQGEKEEVNTL